MVDWGRVTSLRAEIGVTDFAEVLEMFLAESDEVILRLRAGKTGISYEAELHALKGAALNLGLTELAGFCSNGERVARQGGVVDVAAVIACYGASRRALLAGLDARFAA